MRSVFAHVPAEGIATLGWHDWNPDPLVVLGLAAITLLYHLHPRIQPRHGHVVAFWAAQAALVVALLSPLEVGAAYLFWLHMLQHLILTLVAAPLFVLATPVGFLGWLSRRPLVGAVLDFLWAPWPALVGYNAVFLFWHLPPAYNLTLHSNAVHVVQHLTFLASAVVFWGVVLGSAPRRIPYGVRIAVVVATAVVQFIPAFVIALSDRVLYAYADAPRLWGWSALDDQRFGGALMWVLMNLAYVTAALALLVPALRQEGTRRGAHHA
ncbi:MAG: cytochrome c oxidase assembly protein [Armatimonadota bacterium]|nr:cytochrome c oxidase assembly protein [Armatimonadota bacterium]MDR5697677.1 cytochrome c oxidase assembly protein [Armatimonadota bacterium]